MDYTFRPNGFLALCVLAFAVLGHVLLPFLATLPFLLQAVGSIVGGAVGGIVGVIVGGTVERIVGGALGGVEGDVDALKLGDALV